MTGEVLWQRQCESLPYPLGDVRLGHVAGGNSQHEVDGVELIEHQLLIVDGQKQAADHPCGAFDAIVEPVAGGDAKNAGRSQVRCIGTRFAVSVEVLSPIKR